MTVLAKYHAARHALAVCKNVDEVMQARDVAEAKRAYAIIANDKTMEVDAVEIRIRAERRLGELIGQQKATVGLNRGAVVAGAKPGANDGSSAVVTNDRRPTLAEAGISKDLSSRAQAIAAVPEAEFEKEVGDWRERVNQEGARVTTRLVKAGKKAQAKPAEPEPGSIPDIADEYEREVKRNAELELRIEALTATDQGKKIDELVRMNEHYRREKDVEMDKNATLQRRVSELERFRSQVVAASGAKDPRAALQWVKAMAATQRKSA